MRRKYKRLIKIKRGKDKDEQEVGPTLMIATATDMREVCVVEGDRAREKAELEDKGKIEKRQTSANRAKKSHDLPPPFSLGQICEKGIF